MNTEVDEKVKKYYKLKEQYENEKRAAYQSANREVVGWNKKIKFKCVSCRRQVDSVFKIIANADGTRNLLGLCGDEITPCKFNLNIHLGSTINNEEEVNIYKVKISELKKKIIVGKNNLLFGYVSREKAVEDFNILKEELQNNTSMYEKVLQLHLNTVNNEETIQKTIESQTTLINSIVELQRLVFMYTKDKTPSFIQDSVDLYVGTILPELDILRELTAPLSAKDYEINYNDPGIVTDEFGQGISQKQQTLKRGRTTAKKTITLKHMPSPPPSQAPVPTPTPLPTPLPTQPPPAQPPPAQVLPTSSSPPSSPYPGSLQTPPPTPPPTPTPLQPPLPPSEEEEERKDRYSLKSRTKEIQELRNNSIDTFNPQDSQVEVEEDE